MRLTGAILIEVERPVKRVASPALEGYTCFEVFAKALRGA